MTGQAISPFAPPKAGLHGATLAAKMSGKVSRLLARNIHTKALAMRNAQPLVTFSFDDVPASACSAGALILEQCSARGTYYVSGGGCGAPSPSGQLATIDQLRAVHARGHEIGCHTYSHAVVAGISSHHLAADIERNRNVLQAVDSAIAVRNFAYPYGNFTFGTKRLLEGRFDSCRSLIPGVNSAVADLGLLRTWPLENASVDRGRIIDLIAQTVRTKGWLIFTSHDVDDAPSRYGVSPALLAFAAVTARDAGCRLVTIAEGLASARGATVQDRT
jgi:peptidoglycan/xylan/chitin deacetylase (PgdA/CDA1 family)